MNKLLSLLIFFFPLYSFAQKEFNALSWKADVTVNTFLVQKLHSQYDARRVALEKATRSRTSMLAYINAARQKFVQLLGDLPAKSDLHPTITGTLQEQGYHIEKIIFESFPHHHVTANLYVPDKKGPFPAVLLFCGHEDVAKATDSYQQTAALFALNGFVVFAVDPISQGERYQLTDDKGKALTRGGTTEHTLLNEASNLFGNSAVSYELWDNERAMDYLVTRKEVDTARIGCAGNSGGGMQTIYFAAFDRRIKAIAPCSYLATRERTMELTGAADGCAQMPNEGSKGMELDDYLIAAAPTPLLILAGRYDFIDYNGVLIAHDELSKVYATLGQSQKLKLFTVDDGHGISKPKREAAVAWFRKWFYKDDKPVTEPDIKTLTAKELLCTASGQVSGEFRDEVTVSKKNLELADAFEKQRTSFLQQKKDTVIRKLGQFLYRTPISSDMTVSDAGTIEKNGLVYSKYILRREDDIPVPILCIAPPGPISNAKGVIIWFSEKGKNSLADSASLIHSYVDNGGLVILADLPGTGETEDKADQNDPKYYNKEYRNAMLALHTGESMPMLRNSAAVMVMRFILNSISMREKPITINATGITTLSALFLSIYAPVYQVNLYGGIRSFREILEKPTEKDWYSYIIPGALKYFDIPDLVKLVGEGKVTFKDGK